MAHLVLQSDAAVTAEYLYCALSAFDFRSLSSTSSFELKNPATENADVWAAYRQLQTYKEEIPELFRTNGLLVASDGVYARMGSLSANEERFMAWRTIDGNTKDPLGQFGELETLVRGVFQREHLLDYLQHFIVFEDDGGLSKKIAAYHRFHAVRRVVAKVLEASAPGGNGKGGVVWHTQGAGKSLEMTCLAGKLMTHPQMKNPTLVVVTDRDDLDGQLHETFDNAAEVLGEKPMQADSRTALREHLNNRPSGGIVFTTIQKFVPGKDEDTFPTLTERDNVVVLCVKRTAASTGSRLGSTSKARQSTAMRNTCGMRCRTRRSSPSPERPSLRRTRTHAASSAITSTSTTLSRR